MVAFIRPPDPTIGSTGSTGNEEVRACMRTTELVVWVPARVFLAISGARRVVGLFVLTRTLSY